MSFIKELEKIIEERSEAERESNQPSPLLTEQYGNGEENVLYHGDNLGLMKSLIDSNSMAGKINMIYIDPPFFSKANYDAAIKVNGNNVRLHAYEDRWNKGLIDYLKMLDTRLLLMKELLAEDGLIWLHLDWHVVHYAKVLMDDIFGAENFVNEIVWTYKSGGSTKKHFARKHDTILVYSKHKDYKFYPLSEKSYNRGFKPYRFKGVEEFQDELGWFTMVNMKDVWNIDMVGRTSGERTGYATQKPEQLISRIIECCTLEGDLCADFFCGSGTLPAVCSKMNRRFIACDAGNLGVESTSDRLINLGASFSRYELDDVKKPIIKPSIKIDFNDDGLVNIQIKKIKEKSTATLVDRKYTEIIEEISKKNSLSFLESWSVDYCFDGKVHRPKDVFISENGRKITNQVCHEYNKSNIISIKVVDVFGNVYFERVNYEGNIKK